MLDLEAIKARRNYSYGNCATPLLAAISDIDALLLEVERLREQNKQLGQALREYSNELDYRVESEG